VLWSGRKEGTWSLRVRGEKLEAELAAGLNRSGTRHRCEGKRGGACGARWALGTGAHSRSRTQPTVMQPSRGVAGSGEPDLEMIFKWIQI
jgi:hypothetical protein